MWGVRLIWVIKPVWWRLAFLWRQKHRRRQTITNLPGVHMQIILNLATCVSEPWTNEPSFAKRLVCHIRHCDKRIFYLQAAFDAPLLALKFKAYWIHDPIPTNENYSLKGPQSTKMPFLVNLLGGSQSIGRGVMFKKSRFVLAPLTQFWSLLPFSVEQQQIKLDIIRWMQDIFKWGIFPVVIR